MVRSIDDRAPDYAYPEAAARVELGTSTQAAPTTAGDSPSDPYAEAELRLRHERTERLIEKANRDQT